MVIIDPTVSDYQSLVAGVNPNSEVHILDPDRDGITQITEILTGFGDQTPTPYTLHPTPPSSLHLISHGAHSGAPLSNAIGWGDSSIHLISHGAPGTLYLGNGTLELNNLEKYRHQLQQWNIPHLYIYGCNVAAGDAGSEFLQQLRQLTQANIAASSTPTGNAALGGNWELETYIGNPHHVSPFSAAARLAYPGLLGAGLVKDINNSGNSSPNDLTVFNDKLYFQANDGTNGTELWVSDGTDAGTQMVKDINNIGNSSPGFLTVFNDKLYFQANDGTNGTELWVSDGTDAGTQMVKDINNSGGSFPYGLTVFNDKL